ncbi:creatininase family protein [Streptomyces sp. NPDC088560]|uniref:creatininase family protein n=1 Tax=Streptomyces sp. NPDC088560 TaxID=3365868 RepID=UPI003801310E
MSPRARHRRGNRQTASVTPCRCPWEPPSSTALICPPAWATSWPRRCAGGRGAGLRAHVTPSVPTGLSEHHTTFGDTLTLTLPTLHAPLRDNRRSVIRVGFSRILIVNGRGGNMTALNALTSELTAEPVTRETSMTMAAFPEPIRAEHLAESHGPRIILPAESTEPVYVATGPGRSPEVSTSALVSRAMRCWSSSWVVR